MAIPSQIDLPNKSLSGLKRSKKLLGHLKEISVVDFDHTDVVRHPLVSKIVKAYSDQKNRLMIKANVILDYSKWKNKIKNPNNYFKKKLQKAI